MSFDRFKSKFVLDDPNDVNALRIYRDAWMYGFDKTGKDEIWQTIRKDPRPQWCAEEFGSLEGKSVVELGPADGYNTAALEALGANVTAIEGNVDAFLRCLILKNHLDLKARFLLGDFTKSLGQKKQYDLIYASGVLYHLQDPIEFLARAAKTSRNLFLWTHYYDPEGISKVEHERVGFAKGHKESKNFGGSTFTYYQKEYHLEHVERAGYIGGLNATCSYLSHDDLFKALDTVGYKVLRIVDDSNTPGLANAVNILATRR